MLRSFAFSKSSRLAAAANNDPAIRAGEDGAAIVILQSALIDLGYDLPVSTRKTGLPDGIYGRETLEAVKRFQKQNGLSNDGVVGRKTMTLLDGRMDAKPKPISKPPLPIAPPSIPSNSNYKIGHEDPRLSRDRGAGPWGSKPPEMIFLALKDQMQRAPFRFAYETKVGPNAVDHLMHFLGNTGSHKTFDLGKMVKESPTTEVAYLTELSQAQEFVETLPEGTHYITSTRVEFATTALDPKLNWFFTVGGYQYWGSGIAYVLPGPRFKLQFAFKLFDRYNWDGDKAVDIPVPAFGTVEVTDQTLAEFHLQGIAREYDQSGSYVRIVEWVPGQATVAPQPYLPPGLQ